MYMRRYHIKTFIFILMIFSLPGKSQNWNLQFSTTYGTYSMKDLKEIQQSLQIQAQPFSAKIVESFPSRFGYDVAFIRTNSKRSIGLFYSYQSTGGRIHYEDYSGELKMDQIINGNSIGAFITGDLTKSESYKLYGGIRVGITATNLKLQNTIVALDQQYLSERYKFESLNLFASPLLGGKVFYNRFYGFLEARYEWHAAKGPLTLNGDGDVYVTVNSDEKAKADWDGFRASVGIGYSFK